MINLIGNNKSITANTYYRIIFSIIYGSLFFYLLPTVVFAQASQETDGKAYTADVVQVDGTKKTVSYYRNQRGAIIAPPVMNGKLVDGSSAPENQVEARIAQKEILVKYDKNAQTMLAMVGNRDLISEAFRDIDLVSELVEQGKPFTKEQLKKRLFGIYIIISSGRNVDSMMKLTETIAINQLKISHAELLQIKNDAESEAIKIWRSTTGAVN